MDRQIEKKKWTKKRISIIAGGFLFATGFMKKALIFTIVILSCIQINAQTLTGMVYDKDTKQPILGVYVYLDGTSIVDVTDNSGKFTLAVKQMINTKLVLRHLGYNTLIIEEPFNNLPDTIYMEEQFTMLGEVFVQADQFSRRQRLRAFREQFLGTTQAGSSCRIVNEDDIQIWFNVATQTLFASSDKPIEIINSYLGYRVLLTLDEFWTKYSDVTLNSNRALNTYCFWRASFTDLNPNDMRIKKRRDDIFEESTRNFFKNLAYNPLFGGVFFEEFDDFLEQGFDIQLISNETKNPFFKIYKGDVQINPRSHFIIKDTLSQKMINIPDSILDKGNLDNSLLKINVSHREKASETYDIRSNLSSNDPSTVIIITVNNLRHSSGIRFFTNTLLVDQYGNIDQTDKVFFTGLMSRIRAGDMLPLDYEP